MRWRRFNSPYHDFARCLYSSVTDLILTQSQLQKHLLSVRSEQGKAAARAALVCPCCPRSCQLLHAWMSPTSPYSPRFLLAMLFLDSRCRFSSRNWELYSSRLRAKEARSRRQFRIYEICYLRNNTFFRYFGKNLPKIYIWNIV